MELDDNINDINMSESSICDSSIMIEEENENKNNKGKKGILNYFNRKNNKSNAITSNEIRLKKDIDELKKNHNISRYCKIILNDYKRIGNTDNFQMIVEFINHFSVKFIFTSDFPFEPPKISFFAGNQYSFLFDSYGDIILDLVKKENWSPTFWISTLIFHIEKKIYEGTKYWNIFDKLSYDYCEMNKIVLLKRGAYNKRNWNDYLNGINIRESIEYLKFSEIKRNKYNDFQL